MVKGNLRAEAFADRFSAEVFPASEALVDAETSLAENDLETRAARAPQDDIAARAPQDDTFGGRALLVLIFEKTRDIAAGIEHEEQRLRALIKDRDVVIALIALNAVLADELQLLEGTERRKHCVDFGD